MESVFGKKHADKSIFRCTVTAVICQKLQLFSAGIKSSELFSVSDSCQALR